MPVYLDSHSIYVYISGSWQDITSDIMKDITATWGIYSDKPSNRLADTGEMKFIVDNFDGKFIPNGAGSLAGWKTNLPVKVVCQFNNEPFTKFYGVIEDIKPNSNVRGYTDAEITVLDWLNYAAEHPIFDLPTEINLTADQAINLLLSKMPIQPNTVNMDTGISVFPAVFDQGGVPGNAYTELARLAASELGYIYLTQNNSVGETLVVENQERRKGTLPYSDITSTEEIELDTEDEFDLATENDEEIDLDVVQTPTFIDITAISMDSGENIINRFSIKTHPRKIDTSYVVLYSLGSPMAIGAGQTLTFIGNYSDPVGGQSCGGTDMQALVATTDYLLNTLANGTGTNITASGTASAVYGANAPTFTIHNGSNLFGYITKLQARGKGIYVYAAVEYIATDMPSINQFGYNSEEIDQKYQDNIQKAKAYADGQVFLEKEPRTIVRSISFLANQDVSMMYAFLQLDVGSLIHVQEINMGISRAYFIQNVSFSLSPSGIIKVTYGLKEFQSLVTGGLSEFVGVFHGSGSYDAINFGYQPNVVQTSPRSYSAWLWDSGWDGNLNGNAFLCAPYSGDVGVYLRYDRYRRITIYTNMFDGYPGMWYSSGSFPQGQWNNIVFSYDAWNVNAAPLLRVNNTLTTLVEGYHPSGTATSEIGANIVVGNALTNNPQSLNFAWNGKIYDPRIYDHLLSAEDITELYNSGVPDPTLVPDGLVFQGLCVPTENLDDYIGHTLTPELKVLDNVFQGVGIPNGIVSGESM